MPHNKLQHQMRKCRTQLSVDRSAHHDWDGLGRSTRCRCRGRAGRRGRGRRPPVRLGATERATAAEEEGRDEGEKRRGEEGPEEEPREGDDRERVRTGEEDGHEAEPEWQKLPSRTIVRQASPPAQERHVRQALTQAVAPCPYTQAVAPCIQAAVHAADEAAEQGHVARQVARRSKEQRPADPHQERTCMGTRCRCCVVHASTVYM